MLDFRPLPHQPLAGSVRPQDVPRLRKLRSRLTRRWTRRVRRQALLAGLAITALAVSLTIVVLFFAVPAGDAAHRLLERLAVGMLALGSFFLAVFSIWRLDRTRRAARAARIRLNHVERRIAALRQADSEGRPAPD